jgi:hypothetical protein
MDRPVTFRRICVWLLAVMLVVMLTGQAVSAYTRPCRDTAACCCTTAAAMPMAPVQPEGIGLSAQRDCCDTTPAKPCDIDRDTHPAVLSHLTVVSFGRVDAPLPAWLAATAVRPEDVTSPKVYDRFASPDRGRPRIYLEILTLLC